MTTSLLLFVIYALCAYRLSVLVVDDEITRPFRDWAATRSVKGKGRWLSGLVHCYWCVSVWIGGAVTLVAVFAGSWAKYPCAALALSAVTGFLSERE